MPISKPRLFVSLLVDEGKTPNTQFWVLLRSIFSSIPSWQNSSRAGPGLWSGFSLGKIESGTHRVGQLLWWDMPVLKLPNCYPGPHMWVLGSPISGSKFGAIVILTPYQHLLWVVLFCESPVGREMALENTQNTKVSSQRMKPQKPQGVPVGLQVWPTRSAGSGMPRKLNSSLKQNSSCFLFKWPYCLLYGFPVFTLLSAPTKNRGFWKLFFPFFKGQRFWGHYAFVTIFKWIRVKISIKLDIVCVSPHD